MSSQVLALLETTGLSADKPARSDGVVLRFSDALKAGSAGLWRVPQRTGKSVMAYLSHTYRQHPTPNPLDDTGTPHYQAARRGPTGWWMGLLALLPIACCGLPLLLAAGVTAGSGAVLGGIAGAVLMVVGAAVLGVWGMRCSARIPLPEDTFLGLTGTRPTLADAALSPSPNVLGAPNNNPRRAGDPNTRSHSTSTQEQQPSAPPLVPRLPHWPRAGVATESGRVRQASALAGTTPVPYASNE